jgi:hypothetical protein
MPRYGGFFLTGIESGCNNGNLKFFRSKFRCLTSRNTVY